MTAATGVDPICRRIFPTKHGWHCALRRETILRSVTDQRPSRCHTSIRHLPFHESAWLFAGKQNECGPFETNGCHATPTHRTAWTSPNTHSSSLLAMLRNNDPADPLIRTAPRVLVVTARSQTAGSFHSIIVPGGWCRPSSGTFIRRPPGVVIVRVPARRFPRLPRALERERLLRAIGTSVRHTEGTRACSAASVAFDPAMSAPAATGP